MNKRIWGYISRFTLFVGVPEITVQMFVFSWLLFKWEKRVRNKAGMI